MTRTIADTDIGSADRSIHRRPFLITENCIQRNPSTNDIAREIDKIIPRLLSSREGPPLRTYPRPFVVTYDRTQQFLVDSVSSGSSCGLCASNFIRIAFTEYLSKKDNREIITGLLTRDTFVKSIDITRRYERNNYLEVTEIVGAPSHQLPNNTYVQDSTAGLPYFTWKLSTNDVLDRDRDRDLEPLINLRRTEDSFETVLRRLDEIASTIAGAVITASPEILSVLKFPLETAPERQVFIVFDSHTYHKYYPNGAGMVVCSSWEDAATFLAQRFPNTRSQAQAPVEPEEESLNVRDLINASFVVPRRSMASSEADEILLDASMRIVHLDLDQSDLNDRLRKIEKNLAPAASIPQQHQSWQSSGMELEFDGEMQAKLNSLYSVIDQLNSEKTELQTMLVSMQESMDSQVRMATQDVEQQYQQQQQQRQQQNQHDKAGETCQSTCQGAEEARRALEETQRVIEEMRQTMEKERQATEEVRRATERVRHATEKERRATKAERHATEEERHATEEAHLAFVEALRMSNEAINYFTKMARQFEQTTHSTAAAAPEETRYGCSVVRRALEN
ncbi:hypothetical protein C0993_006990 [Termitomyces sp. T159_Od127]|nr:hypothetical protein C0993_006990 [Termitomyces sp. T159_Od127]